MKKVAAPPGRGGGLSGQFTGPFHAAGDRVKRAGSLRAGLARMTGSVKWASSLSGTRCQSTRSSAILISRLCRADSGSSSSSSQNRAKRSSASRAAR